MVCRDCQVVLDGSNCWQRPHVALCRGCEQLQINCRQTPGFRAGLRTAALSYAERGWQLLPLATPTLAASASGRLVPSCSCGCVGPRAGKHPRIQKDDDPLAFATNRKSEILKWFDWWPNQNIGVVCSQESGVFGIDVDYSYDGRESLVFLEHLIGEFYDKAARSRTADGCHLYFKHPGLRIPDFHNLLPGIDIRSERSYLVAPPSLHASGVVYRWEKERDLQVFPVESTRKLLKLMERSEGSIYNHSSLPQKSGQSLKEIQHKFRPEDF